MKTSRLDPTLYKTPLFKHQSSAAIMRGSTPLPLNWWSGAWLVVGTWCLMFLLAQSIGAQSFGIDWYKIAGGGGTSSNSQYTASGTIGQPDAGAHDRRPLLTHRWLLGPLRHRYPRRSFADDSEDRARDGDRSRGPLHPLALCCSRITI